MPNKPLTKEQQEAQAALLKLLADPGEADKHYDALTDSHGGQIISTDIARSLDKRYRDTPMGLPRDLAPSQDHAWRYARDRFQRELSERKQRKAVRFMAGGWGAGKTLALEGSPILDLAWDGTLEDSRWAADMIDLALANGWLVEIAYVFRDLELALYGAVTRSKIEGRSVPLKKLPSNHHSVQRSIRQLIQKYGSDNSVSFILVHNIGSDFVKGQSVLLRRDRPANRGTQSSVKKPQKSKKF